MIDLVVMNVQRLPKTCSPQKAWSVHTHRHSPINPFLSIFVTSSCKSKLVFPVSRLCEISLRRYLMRGKKINPINAILIWGCELYLYVRRTFFCFLEIVTYWSGSGLKLVTVRNDNIHSMRFQGTSFQLCV